ncbi:MAG: TonB family protein [Pyrinomonadaceae bacterium]
MKRILIAALLTLTASSPVVSQATNAEADREINEGARLYRAGKLAEAQRRFERALELDPSHRRAPIFIARSIHAQYRPGDETPENIAAAEAAVEAYKRVLAGDPHNDEAFNAVVYLYRHMKREVLEREMLLVRANNASAAKEKRSEAYTVLALKEWECAYDITDQKKNKETVQEPGGSVTIRYKMPKDVNAFRKAQRCAARGLELIEQAVALNPESESAWVFKTNLLREMAKLAEMEGKAEDKERYSQEAGKAQGEYTRLSEESLRKMRSGEETGRLARADDDAELVPRVSDPLMLVVPVVPESDPAPSDVAPQPPRKVALISGGVLNGKALSKPEPAYPPVARAARAQGTVTVQILVDEQGRVISAQAVSGHPLLQQAAVAAARQARFSPTRLQGQPVKVSGVVTYNFVLR